MIIVRHDVGKAKGQGTMGRVGRGRRKALVELKRRKKGFGWVKEENERVCSG